VSRASLTSGLAVVALLLGACSDGSSTPPTTPAIAPSPATPATTADPTPAVATTSIPFAGGINGPVSPGSTEPVNR
jgi:hypothetical protein